MSIRPDFAGGAPAVIFAPAPDYLLPAPQHAAYAATPSFPAIYAFGDSLSDAGNDYKVSLGVLPTGFIYSDGRFSNGNTWVQNLSIDLGLGTLKASLNGGNDYAYGGAETGSETLHSVLPNDLPSELAQFLVTDPSPSANALYTLSIGANDTIDAIGAYATNPSGALTDISQAVGNELTFIKELALDGARNFLIMNVPDLGKTPEEASHAAVASQLSALYDSDLLSGLQTLVAQDHLSIHLIDAYALIDQAVANPGAFGLKNVTSPVWTGNYDNPFSGHLNATGSAQNAYLFFDQLHPTETGHLAIAAAGLTALNTIV